MDEKKGYRMRDFAERGRFRKNTVRSAACPHRTKRASRVVRKRGHCLENRVTGLVDTGPSFEFDPFPRFERLVVFEKELELVQRVITYVIQPANVHGRRTHGIDWHRDDLFVG